MPVPLKKSPSTPAAPLTPEQKIKALEVQFRDANEKAQLFEAEIDVLKKDDGVRIVKSLRASPRAKAPPGAERGEGLPPLASAARPTTSSCIELVRGVRLRQPRLGVRKLPSRFRALLQPAQGGAALGARDGQRAGVGADTTYLPTDKGFVYLSLVTAAWSQDRRPSRA